MFKLARFLHIASGLGFMGIHGASIVVLYIIRRETDRGRIEALMGFSAKTVIPMYISLIAVVASGLWLGFIAPGYFSQVWYWLSIGLLGSITLVMWLVARPFGKRILAACEIRPSGVPRKSDEELEMTVRSQKTNAITAIGVIGLGLVLWLMVYRPLF